MINKQQLIDTIKYGDRTIENRLILKTNGTFALIPYQSQEDWDNFTTLRYVARWGTFEAANDYVGAVASEDSEFIDGIFQTAERAWSDFRAHGKLRVLLD